MSILAHAAEVDRQPSGPVVKYPKQTWKEWQEEVKIFYKEFGAKPHTIWGSLTSWWATRRLCDHFHGRYIIDIGGGTGRNARQLLLNLPPDGKIAVIEPNPRFVEFMKEHIDDTRVKVYKTVAMDIANVAKDAFNSEPADGIIDMIEHTSKNDIAAVREFEYLGRHLKEGAPLTVGNYRWCAGRQMAEAMKSPVQHRYLLLNPPPITKMTVWKPGTEKPRLRIFTGDLRLPPAEQALRARV